MRKETVLLVDGDILAYRAAAASEKRTVIVKHLPSGKEKVFKNRTEFKDSMKAKEKEYNVDEYTFTDIQTPEDISYCLYSIKARLKVLQEETKADRVEVYVGGATNFRNDLLLPSKYKDRAETIRPLHLIEAKNYLVQHHSSIKSWEIEADDVLSIRGFEELSKGNKAVIGTVDKDTYQGEGLAIYDWTVEKPVIQQLSKDPLGYLEDTGKKVIGSGLKFLALQILAGDPVDTYKPSELAKVKYGAKSAYKLLVDLPDTKAVCDAVVVQYKKWYPEAFTYTAWNGKVVENATWEDILGLYFKCAWMRRTWDDQSDWKTEFTKRWNYAI